MFFSPLCNTLLSLQGKCVFLFNCVSVELWVVLGRRRVREGGRAEEGDLGSLFRFGSSAVTLPCISAFGRSEAPEAKLLMLRRT